jgi:methyl acetate hydrolase
VRGQLQPRLRPGFSAAADGVLRRCVERENGVPGVVALVTDRQGTIYEGVSGLRDLGRNEGMTTDTVFGMYSCTKALTAAAVMQLVEAGLLDLADPAKKYVPELGKIRVLDGFDADGEPLLRPSKTDISIEQLLLHTAGFGYEFFDPDLLRYGTTAHATRSAVSDIPVTRSVLVFDPGTRWLYGSSIDWVGEVVENVRGERLGDVMRKHLFEPLDMRDTGFRLSPAMRARRATDHQRSLAGTLEPKPKAGLPQDGQADLGGSGLFATAADYAKFIRMILNDGAAPTGELLLKPRTVATMATNRLAPLTVRPLPGTLPKIAHTAEFLPGLRKSWGYSWMINDEPAPTGRPAGALGWAGLANLFYWIDRHNGIGGFWATQIFPFIDGVSLPAYLEFETTVYQHLR